MSREEGHHYWRSPQDFEGVLVGVRSDGEEDRHVADHLERVSIGPAYGLFSSSVPVNTNIPG